MPPHPPAPETLFCAGQSPSDTASLFSHGPFPEYCTIRTDPASHFNTSVRIPRQQHAVLVMEQKAASKDNQDSGKAAEIPKGFESEVSQPCGILFPVDW